MVSDDTTNSTAKVKGKSSRKRKGKDANIDANTNDNNDIKRNTNQKKVYLNPLDKLIDAIYKLKNPKMLTI